MANVKYIFNFQPSRHLPFGAFGRLGASALHRAGTAREKEYGNVMYVVALRWHIPEIVMVTTRKQ